MKVHSAVCSATCLNNGKYLCNSSVRFAAVSYKALNDFIGRYSKTDRHKSKAWGWEKNEMNLNLEFSRTSTTELFCKNS